MTDLLSNSDTFINPFLRIREEHGLTQLQLQRDLGLSSAQVIRRTEQGLYAHPTPRIIQYLADLEGVSYDSLQKEYYIWQKQTRQRNCSKILAGLQNYIDNPRGYKLADFIYAVTPESRMAFCKLLCINPAQIDPVASRRDLPQFIKDALDDANVDSSVIDHINHIMAFGRR